MEFEESTCLTSGSTTKPKSSKHMVLAQRQKYRSMEQNRKSRHKSTHPWTPYMDTLSSTKEARIYNGLKTIFLTSGAGKTGQPLVKE